MRKRKEGDYRLSREFATGCLHTGMTKASGKDSVGVQKEVADGVVSVRKRKDGDKGSMKVADFLKMTEDDRKVVR